MNTTPDFSCDVLIIGSGAAGLSLALRLAEHSSVTVLSKGPISEGSTFYAQGGIAAVFDETDSIESHVEDTLICRRRVMRSPCGHLRRQQCQIMRPVAYRSGRIV
ncbi:FAD-dependent oxidoreductase [Klebsiella pneumoniae]|nr:FAD-dependent oxidoreductase [Klebsiella pneumoniae]